MNTQVARPFVTNDCRGKVLRPGDRVHAIEGLRRIAKKKPNGRVLAPLRNRKIVEITDYTKLVPCDCTDGCEKCEGSKLLTALIKSTVQLQGKMKREYAPSELIKE